MKSSMAIKVIIVICGMLNLDSDVLDTHIKMMFYLMLNLLQALERVCRSNVSAASIFAFGKSPHVEIVHFGNTFAILDCFLKLLVVAV